MCYLIYFYILSPNSASSPETYSQSGTKISEMGFIILSSSFSTNFFVLFHILGHLSIINLGKRGRLSESKVNCKDLGG